MIADFHSHSWYSGCGRDNPEELVKKMIDEGVEIYGMTDHNYGIGNRKKEYFYLQSYLQEKYKDKIKMYRGIELCTAENLHSRDEDISFFDYCLIEHLDREDSIIHNDIVSYAKSFGIKGTGIAHTDLFSYCKKMGYDEYEFFKKLKDNHIFWEMNVTYDSVHGYHEHQYVKDFRTSKYQQDLIRNVGLTISVGFDGHRMEEYRVDRVDRKSVV